MRWLTLALVGCGGHKDDDDGIVPPPGDDDDDDTTPPTDTAEPASPDLVVEQDNVYHVTVDWTLAASDVRSSYDAVVSWDGLTTDLWGQPIDNATIPVFALLEILYPPDQLPEHLDADDLGGDLLAIWELDATGATFASVSGLTSGAASFDYGAFLLDEPGKTWLAALANRDGERLDLRAAIALQAVDGSGVTAVDIDDTTSAVDWSGAFDGAPLTTSAGNELYTVDWQAVTTDALGKPYDAELGDQLFVGRWDGKSPADLALEIPALSASASAWYTMDVTRDTDARLDLARDASNAVFPGFTAGSTWVMGVRCGTCLTAFPLWAVVVEVE